MKRADSHTYLPTVAKQVAERKIDRPPFNDVRVRQALRLTIDIRAIQRLVHGDRGSPA
jgi:ABC-type oligopeptide transport system substrate-binding subunit